MFSGRAFPLCFSLAALTCFPPFAAADPVRRPVPLGISVEDLEGTISGYCDLESTVPVRPEFDIYPVKEERRYECTNQPQLVVAFGNRVYQFDVRFDWRTGARQGYSLAGLIGTGLSDGYAAARRSPDEAFGGYVSRAGGSIAAALERDPARYVDATYGDISFICRLEGDHVHILTLPAPNLDLLKARLSSAGRAGGTSVVPGDLPPGTSAEKKRDLPLSWEEIAVPDRPDFTAAASYRPVLPAENLTDGDPRTAWAGRTGDEVWLFINGGASSMSVINGYNKTPALFRANNRVRRLEVSVWAAFHFAGSVSETSRIFDAARLTPGHVLELKDLGTEQTFPLPFDWERIRAAKAEALAELVKREDFKDRELVYSYFVLRARPLEVYRGTKYGDTCISELKAGIPWLHEARLHGDWSSVSGPDKRSMTFSEPWKDRAFASYLGGKPLLTGTWLIENGELVVKAGGATRRYKLSLEGTGGDSLLKLTGADGRTEVYKYKPR